MYYYSVFHKSPIFCHNATKLHLPWLNWTRLTAPTRYGNKTVQLSCNLSEIRWFIKCYLISTCMPSLHCRTWHVWCFCNFLRTRRLTEHWNDTFFYSTVKMIVKKRLVEIWDAAGRCGREIGGTAKWCHGAVAARRTKQKRRSRASAHRLAAAMFWGDLTERNDEWIRCCVCVEPQGLPSWIHNFF